MTKKEKRFPRWIIVIPVFVPVTVSIISGLRYNAEIILIANILAYIINLIIELVPYVFLGKLWLKKEAWVNVCIKYGIIGALVFLIFLQAACEFLYWHELYTEPIPHSVAMGFFIFYFLIFSWPIGGIGYGIGWGVGNLVSSFKVKA